MSAGDANMVHVEHVGADLQADGNQPTHLNTSDSGSTNSDAEPPGRIVNNTTPHIIRPPGPIPTPRRISHTLATTVAPVNVAHPDQQPLSTINALFKTVPFDETRLTEWIRLLNRNFVLFGVHMDSLKITLMSSYLPKILERNVTRELALLNETSFTAACRILHSWCEKPLAQRIHELEALPKSLGSLKPSELLCMILDILEEEPFLEEHVVFYLKRLPKKMQRKHQTDNMAGILENPILFARKLDKEAQSNALIDGPTANVAASRSPAYAPPKQVHLPPSASSQPPRPAPSSRADKYLCYYHKRYGVRARSCGKNGCTWYERIAAVQRDSFTDNPENA